VKIEDGAFIVQRGKGDYPIQILSFESSKYQLGMDSPTEIIGRRSGRGTSGFSNGNL